MSFNFEKTKTIKHNKTTINVIKVHNVNRNKDITIKQIANIYKTITYQAHLKNKKIKIMIRGLALDKWVFLKGYDNKLDESEQAFEEYYSNRVADATKFSNFGQLQFYVAESNTKDEPDIPKPKAKKVKKMFIK